VETAVIVVPEALRTQLEVVRTGRGKDDWMGCTVTGEENSTVDDGHVAED
jgi:hypothetical protein